MKKCSKCQTEKPHNEFSKDKNRKDGRYPQCRTCRREYTQANKERIRVRDKKRYDENREEILQQKKVYYTENRDEIRTRFAKWKASNPDWSKEYHAEHREERLAYNREYHRENADSVCARKRRNYRRNLGYELARRFERRINEYGHDTDISIDPSIDLLTLLEKYNSTCQYCGKAVIYGEDVDWRQPDYATVDHVIPVSDPRTSHTWGNVTLSCFSCNAAKGGASLDDFLRVRTNLIA